MNAPARLWARELTPRGSGAVSVVEFLGPDAAAHVRGLGAPSGLRVGEARLARLRLAHGLVDEALVVCRAPDRVEVHVHGSPAIARALCEGLRAGPASDAGLPGARGLLGPGTLEQRALALLARAACESAARILLDQAEGALRAELERLARLPSAAARALAAELARRGRCARRALEPARVVLAGPVNAGKSTLFNVLAGEARALVADEPGTTRDVLAADVLLGDWPVSLYDTAGERALAGDAGPAAVEAEGQRRARLARSGAELVLWLVPSGSEDRGAPEDAVLLHTQSDRVAAAPPGAISALADPGGARRRVGEILRARLDLPAEAWVPRAGVPFERAQVEELAAAARGDRDPRALADAWLAAE